MWSVRKKGKSRKKRQQQALLKRSEILFGSFVLLRRQVTAIFFFFSTPALLLCCCCCFSALLLKKKQQTDHRGGVLFLKLPLARAISLKMLQIYHPARREREVFGVVFSHNLASCAERNYCFNSLLTFSNWLFSLNTFKFQHHHHHRSPSNRTFMFDWIALRLFLSPANNNNNIIELKMKSQPRTDGRARNCSLRYFLNQPGGFNM